MSHLPLQDQRFGFLHLPHQGLDRVTAQPAKRRNSLMTVNDHVTPRLMAVGHHHDRLLLAVLFQAQAEPTLLLTTHHAKRRVGHLQLVEFQFHDRSSDTPRPSGAKPQPGGHLGELSATIPQGSQDNPGRLPSTAPAADNAAGRTLDRRAPTRITAEAVFGLFADSVSKPPDAWEP